MVDRPILVGKLIMMNKIVNVSYISMLKITFMDFSLFTLPINYS